MKSVEDPRSPREKKHELAAVLTYLVAGYVTGHITLRRCLGWCQRHEKWLKKNGLPLPNGIASLSTVSRLLSTIDELLFLFAFIEWIGTIVSTKGVHLAVDGKALRAAAEKCKGKRAPMMLHVMEAATGLIIYSDEAKGYAETTTKQAFGLGGRAGFDATLSDKAISAALSQLVENIINKCMDKPWKSYILSADDGSYVISGGVSQGLAPNDIFNVYKKGKVVTNPQTGIKIELPGVKIGTVTVLNSIGDTPETEISFCNYSGDPINTEKLEDYYISDK